MADPVDAAADAAKTVKKSVWNIFSIALKAMRFIAPLMMVGIVSAATIGGGSPTLMALAKGNGLSNIFQAAMEGYGELWDKITPFAKEGGAYLADAASKLPIPEVST